MREVSAQMKAIAAVVREHVAKAFGALSGRVDALEELIKGLPTPRDGASVTIDDVRPLIDDAVKAIPAPENGKDADPEVIRQMVDDAVAAIPAPKDGESVTAEDVRPVINEAVKAAVDALPAPKDGKGCDPEELLAAVKEAVSQALESVPAPKDGQSVTAEDVRPLISEEVARAVASMPSPKGGESVPIDQVQKMVDEAVNRAVSALPKPADGRDACDIEILPAIDEAKSYARGTYATHDGGLWRAYQATDGMRGWDCIVDGVAEHRIEADGERNFAVVLVRASGAQDRKELIVPAVIDRGVHSAERDYDAGDATTWAGSLWIAQKDSPIGRPGDVGSDGWRLAVKRGRDGKNGRNGIDRTAPVKLEPSK